MGWSQVVWASDPREGCGLRHQETPGHSATTVPWMQDSWSDQIFQERPGSQNSGQI